MMLKPCAFGLLAVVTFLLTSITYLFSNVPLVPLDDLSEISLDSPSFHQGPEASIADASSLVKGTGDSNDRPEDSTASDRDLPEAFSPVWLPDRLPKYFIEPKLSRFEEDRYLDRYDRRFYHSRLPKADRIKLQVALIQAYLRLFAQEQLETWLAHGTLLGWWWNQKSLPWDWDLDTQVTLDTLAILADDFNGTVFTSLDGKQYLLDVNPAAAFRQVGGGNNKIDARWIDIDNGLYIDITALSTDEANGTCAAKDGHQYRCDHIWPLQNSEFEGMPALVPRNVEFILREEYGRHVLSRTRFHDHLFDAEARLWVLEYPDYDTDAELTRLLEPLTSAQEVMSKQRSSVNVHGNRMQTMSPVA